MVTVTVIPSRLLTFKALFSGADPGPSASQTLLGAAASKFRPSLWVRWDSLGGCSLSGRDAERPALSGRHGALAAQG